MCRSRATTCARSSGPSPSRCPSSSCTARSTVRLLSLRIDGTVSTDELDPTGSVYYSEHKYILAGIQHAQLLSFDGVGHSCVALSSLTCAIPRVLTAPPAAGTTTTTCLSGRLSSTDSSPTRKSSRSSLPSTLTTPSCSSLAAASLSVKMNIRASVVTHTRALRSPPSTPAPRPPLVTLPGSRARAALRQREA